MKSLIFACLFICMSVSCIAQQFGILYYQADDKLVYLVQKAVPGSMLEFYSTRSGGKLLLQTKADKDGNATVEHSRSFRPAFVLNSSTNGLPAGNGKVRFLDIPEFIMQNIEVKHDVNTNLISWDCSVARPEGYSLSLERSINGQDFLPLKQFVIDKHTHYSFRDDTIGLAVYRVRIINQAKGIDYVSKEYLHAGVLFNIYPVPFKDKINIETSCGISTYAIYNSNGLIVLKGVGSKQSVTTIDMQQLPAGIYYLKARTNNNTEIAHKLTKQ